MKKKKKAHFYLKLILYLCIRKPSARDSSWWPGGKSPWEMADAAEREPCTQECNELSACCVAGRALVLAGGR